VFETAHGSLDSDTLDLSTVRLIGSPKEEAAGLHPPPPRVKLKKITDFVDTMKSKILRDLPKSAIEAG
jgi:hypothetical protein